MESEEVRDPDLEPGNDFSSDSTMSEAELNYLITNIKNSKCFLEFGAGFSTKQALQNPSTEVISVETSSQYIEKLSVEIGDLGLDLSRVTFIHIDIGPTGDWGRPVDESGINRWPNYSNHPWKIIKEKGFKPDLILIDGRFRVSTFLQAWRNAPGCKVIFDDFNNREYYHKVIELLSPRERVGRIATFEIPNWKRLTKYRLWKRLSRIYRYEFQ